MRNLPNPDQLHPTMGAFFRAGLVAGETCMIAPDTRRQQPDQAFRAPRQGPTLSNTISSLKDTG